MTQVKFTATKLAAGKKGILTPDEDGYYTFPVGSLNAFNSQGSYYVSTGVRELFEQSSVFMRRIANGNLKGEMGHPKMTPGMTMQQYMERAMVVEEKNVCCHFKEVWLDEDFGRNHPEYKNPKMIAIMAKLKPAGPMGPALQASIDNPHENVCFSIRCLTRDYLERGQRYKVIEQIVNFDNVTEPGIATATKWSSPTLETIYDEVVRRSDIENTARPYSGVLSVESSEAMIAESMRVFDRKTPPKPLYSHW